jgi:ATP-binding cassette subfamily F protein uup
MHRASSPTSRNSRSNRFPVKIEEAQAKLAKIEAEMADPKLFAKDPDGFAARARTHDTLKSDIEAMEGEWLELEMLREEIEGN